MSFAWCVLRWGQLVFFSAPERWFGERDPMLARLLMALCISAGSLLLVLLVTLVLKESKEGGTPDFYALSSSLGLLIGHVWMACFYQASLGFMPPTVRPSTAGGLQWEDLIPAGLMHGLLVLLVLMW